MAALGAGATIQAWAQRHHGPGNGANRAFALTVDGDGNVYVTGDSYGTNGFTDYATIAYSSGGAALWTNRYGGPANGSDKATAISADPDGSIVYVTGYSYRSMGITALYDFATIAYSASGTALWTNRYNQSPPTYAQAQALAVGADGNVYVGGPVGGMQAHFVTIAYSSVGAALWTNIYGRAVGSTDILAAIGVGVNGNVYVTGSSDDSRGAANYATVAYTSRGTPLWTNRYNGPATNISVATALAVGSGSEVYVTGYSLGSDATHDYATVAYANTGDALWTNRYSGPANSFDYGRAIIADHKGQLYVTGESFNSSGYSDYATVAYSTNGAGLWTNRFSGEAQFNNSAQAVAVDSSGEVIVTGWSDSASAGRDYATVAYSSAGTPLWTNRYNGPIAGNDYMETPLCLAAGPEGAVYVTGTSDGTNYSDYATIKYVPRPEIRFTMIRPLSDGSYRLRLSASTNYAFQLEASSDLFNWLTLTSFPPLPQSRIMYTDIFAPNFPRRFYRTVWHP